MKYTKILRAVLLVLLLVPLTFFACGDDEPQLEAETVRLSASELAIPHEGGTLSVHVEAGKSWSAYASDKDNTWLSVSPSYNADPEGTLVVTASPNSAYSNRTGSVFVKCGSTRKEITVTQEAKPREPMDPNIQAPEGYGLVWHDEFDADGNVDAANWRFENWAPGFVNNELQRYVAGGELDGQRTAFIDNGILCIRAMKHNGQVISARMNTKGSWKYGYFEARIKLPKGKGTWPAFWMMPDDQSSGWPTCGEIDIMEEVGYHPNYTSSSIHCSSYNHTIGTQKTAERLTAGAEDEFHVYALEWTVSAIRTFVDGKELLNFPNDGKGNISTWPFDKTFYITLNLAWGGSWGGAQGVDESALPATMEVDYVRVFQKY